MFVLTVKLIKCLLMTEQEDARAEVERQMECHRVTSVPLLILQSAVSSSPPCFHSSIAVRLFRKRLECVFVCTGSPRWHSFTKNIFREEPSDKGEWWSSTGKPRFLTCTCFIALKDFGFICFFKKTSKSEEMEA